MAVKRARTKPSTAPDSATIKTSLFLDAETYQRAERYALDLKHKGERKTMGDIVSEALADYLKKHSA